MNRKGLRAQVKEFHRAFGLPVKGRPTVPTPALARLRLRLVAEEFFELMNAAYAGNSLAIEYVSRAEATLDFLLKETENVAPIDPKIDLPGLVDALGDLDYVVEGFRLALGVDGCPVATEIHRANMAKLGDDGKPCVREDGKILKAPGWSPPDVEMVLIDQGWVQDDWK